MDPPTNEETRIREIVNSRLARIKDLVDNIGEDIMARSLTDGTCSAQEIDRYFVMSLECLLQRSDRVVDGQRKKFVSMKDYKSYIEGIKPGSYGKQCPLSNCFTEGQKKSSFYEHYHKHHELGVRKLRCKFRYEEYGLCGKGYHTFAEMRKHYGRAHKGAVLPNEFQRSSEENRGIPPVKRTKKQ